ncbi:hypothetical protein Vi05172_g9542 [Venturia inaequalis]|nr:hypothetical protein Vi05172_g9542 [Venturia inaequalis]
MKKPNTNNKFYRGDIAGKRLAYMTLDAVLYPGIPLRVG